MNYKTNNQEEPLYLMKPSTFDSIKREHMSFVTYTFKDYVIISLTQKKLLPESVIKSIENIKSDELILEFLEKHGIKYTQNNI
tara:strand:+ start:1045 stop:1293 length:249 start_codon:yes stop_codon:yes gene_type:complete